MQYYKHYIKKDITHYKKCQLSHDRVANQKVSCHELTSRVLITFRMSLSLINLSNTD